MTEQKPIKALPDSLLQAVLGQRCVLFLGAGASMEAIDSAGNHPPGALQLRQKLGQEFFGNDMAEYDLVSLSELAIQNSGQALVFERIKTILEPFEPSAAHKMMPAFRWRAIVTTNYDMLVDKAYSSDRARLQTLVPFVKDSEPVEDRLQRATRPLPYLKLHGCLDHLHDRDIPLILSHEHYATHMRHRTHLYHRVQAWAHESTFIFCGYRLGDAHIRTIIYDLEAMGIKRPTYYLVAPGVNEHDETFWAAHNVQLINATFGQFMAALDVAIPTFKRVPAVHGSVLTSPISKHFKTNQEIPDSLAKALAQDLTLVHSAMAIEPQDAKRFYEGFDTGWGAIAQRLDVQRKPVEDLLLDAVLEPLAAPSPELYIFTGPAGVGKTIALKRAAWEAAADFNALALWLNDTGAVTIDVFADLYRLCGKRMYMFVDRLALHADGVEALLNAAKVKKLPITVVAADRINELNVTCPKLLKVATELEIPNLSPGEIHGLLDLLQKHNALGFLSGKTRDEQVRAFTERAERVLLVALHEATLGKPFQQLVLEEYKGVFPDQARQLYLDICTMHQFGIPIRAGTVSRISGIRFVDFQSDFLGPLERIVLTCRDTYTGDMQYKARHSRVARLVFEQACPSDRQRSEQMVRIMSALDIGYTVDKMAMEQITKARRLVQSIQDPEHGRVIYRTALQTAPDAAWILHQWANFELNHPRGDIGEADRLAREASEFDPRNKSIKHTQAGIARRRALATDSSLMRQQLRRLARDKLDEARADNDSHIMSSRCKLIVDEIDDLTGTLSDPPTAAETTTLRDRIKDCEIILSRARQLFPDDAEFHQIEARLSGILNQKDRAVRALEKAWQANPPGSSVAIRLSRHYGKSDPARSLQVLQTALERNPDDKAAHLEMAKHLLTHNAARTDLINQHLSRSYLTNDNNHEARHMHAQFMFATGKAGDAWSLFQLISVTAPSEFRQREEESQISKGLPRYQGTIATLKTTMAFIRSSVYTADIFAHSSGTKREVWRQLRAGDAVTFSIRFSRSGPVAVAIALPDA